MVAKLLIKGEQNSNTLSSLFKRPNTIVFPHGKLVNHDGNATNSFLFTGEQLDSETEDYYLRARYYSTNSGVY